MKRALGLGLATALVVTTAACGTQGSPSPTPSAPAAEGLTGVELSVTAEAAPEPALRSGQPPVTRVIGAESGLLIRYVVRNTRSADVLVVDRLPNGGLTMNLGDEPDPLRAVLRPGPGGQVDVVKTAQLGGTGLDYTPTVQASVVASGASHEGRVFVPFPAGNHDGPKPFPSEATKWRFCLGVFPDASIDTPRSTDGRVALVPGSGSDDERLVCSQLRPLPDGWF